MPREQLHIYCENFSRTIFFITITLFIYIFFGGACSSTRQNITESKPKQLLYETNLIELFAMHINGHIHLTTNFGTNITAWEVLCSHFMERTSDIKISRAGAQKINGSFQSLKTSSNFSEGNVYL